MTRLDGAAGADVQTSLYKLNVSNESSLRQGASVAAQKNTDPVLHPTSYVLLFFLSLYPQTC